MELFIKQELLKLLPSLDAVLFDIDGVILDVAGSFRQVIAGAAQFYATNVMHLEDTGPLISTQDTELFKLAGGFNDDWELCNAVVALIIARQAQSGAKDTQSIAAQEPDWASYTRDIKRRGGGLSHAEGVILEMLNPTERREFARGWNPKLVTQLCQELYAGDEMCRPLYGFAPEHIHGEGLHREEKPLLDTALLQALPSRVQIGILTGRSRSETNLALQFSGVSVPEDARITSDDGDGARKPDPKTLSLLRDQMGFKQAIYIGDTMDDLKTVQNYRERGHSKAKIYSAIALSGPSGGAHRRLFLEAGAEIVAPDANALLQYLGAVLK